MKLIRGLGALSVLLAVLVGAPLALLAGGRYPSGWSGLMRPDDGSLWLVVLTAVGWLAWTAFTVATLVEAVQLVSGARFRLPLLGGLQQLSAGLLLAVLSLAPASTSASPAPAAVVAAVPQAEPDADRVYAEPVREPTTASAAEAGGYVVESGDDLWSLSESLLGDGSRWREVVAANPDTLADPTVRLTAGTRLVLPASALAPKQVVVERGDTLSGLALEHLGTAKRWPAIAAANADLIEDPDHIEIGWRLDLPAAHASRSSDAKPERDAAPAHEPDDEPSADRGTGEGPNARSGPEPPSTTPPELDQGPVAATAQAEAPAEVSDDQDLPAIGVIGSLAAAALIGTLEARRYVRLRSRPVGRRLISPTEPETRLRTAIGRRQRPDGTKLLDAALRTIGEHCFTNTRQLPALERATLGETTVSFQWVHPAGAPPSGFEGDDRSWRVEFSAATLRAPDWPCPYPALVSLGETASGDTLLLDAERSRVLGVAAATDELRRAALAAMALELACAPWSRELRLIAAGDEAAMLALAGGDRVEVAPSINEAIARLRCAVADRRRALAGEPLARLRVDPDRADAVAPLVLVLNTRVDAALAEELDELLAGPATGAAVLLGSDSGAPALWQVSGEEYAPSGQLTGSPGRLLAHSIPAATRAGVASLLRAADDPADTPAPWWGDPTDNVRPLPQRANRGEEAMDIVRLLPVADAPRALLIGPVDLLGAAGPAPVRSRQQLVEACAWLLENPGRSATEMSLGLGVAEGTRRSNLSRLRAWLGSDPAGKPYLPDAYSGRIRLHPAVTSDWESVQALLRPGIDRVSDATLVAALELVRGAPLADVAPGLWHWAEELRTDLSSALRDVGLVLADRALANGDVDLARWAASRALVVAPEDEQLLCARIRTEHRAGNRAEVERLVNQVSRQARALEVDLLPETVTLCQQVIEGRLRARRA